MLEVYLRKYNQHVVWLKVLQMVIIALVVFYFVVKFGLHKVNIATGVFYACWVFVLIRLYVLGSLKKLVRLIVIELINDDYIDFDYLSVKVYSLDKLKELRKKSRYYNFEKKCSVNGVLGLFGKGTDLDEPLTQCKNLMALDVQVKYLKFHDELQKTINDVSAKLVKFDTMLIGEDEKELEQSLKAKVI
jgi:hypothetical protein